MSETDQSKQVKSQIKSIISSIKSCKNPAEIALLINISQSLIDEYFPEDAGLREYIAETSRSASTKVTLITQKAAEESKKDLPTIFPEHILPEISKEKEITVNLHSLSEIVDFAMKQDIVKEKPNLYDGAFGEVIKALEAEKAKEEHREESAKRFDTLKEISSALSPASTLTEEQKQEIIQKASDQNITLQRDESGKLQVSKKTKKALAKVASLDLEEIERKRSARKAKLNQPEEINLASLFGKSQDDETPSLSDKQTPDGGLTTKTREHIVPERVKEVSEVKFINVITPEIKSSTLIAHSKAKESKGWEK